MKTTTVTLTRRHWDTMEPRERDRWIASSVFAGIAQWKKPPYVMCLCPYEPGPFIEKDGTWSAFCLKCGEPKGYHNGFPRFSTELEADYLVLEHVRNEWIFSTRQKFSHALATIFGRQSTAECWPDRALRYRPGDYSHAAFLALEMP